MHIEPGLVTPVKVTLANVSALSVFAWGIKEHLTRNGHDLWLPLKALAAALFFSLFMQSFHMPIGPSELHFVGAMAIYLTLGFIPTLLGFAIGLFLQGILFEPTDLVHLGVNSLSLIVPLLGVHYGLGRKLFAQGLEARLNLARILKLDASYYAGVTAMVGFWLFIGEDPTPLADWLAFAASYLAVVALEPFVTWGAVWLLRKYREQGMVARLFAV